VFLHFLTRPTSKRLRQEYQRISEARARVEHGENLDEEDKQSDNGGTGDDLVEGKGGRRGREREGGHILTCQW